MTISNENEFEALKEIGRIVAETLKAMGAALEPGITTAELDALGRKLLEQAGARSGPEVTYNFPGATCISVNEEIAHGRKERLFRRYRRVVHRAAGVAQHRAAVP
jgi:methionyl aminopeptidase